MKAIITKKLPATNYLPDRVQATASGVQSLVISYWAEDDAHAAAALALARREGWKGELARGGLPINQARLSCLSITATRWGFEHDIQ